MGPGTRFCQVSATASAGSNPPANPMSSRPWPAAGGCRTPTASRAERTCTPGLALEFLEVCLPRAVGVGFGEGELGVHVEQRWRGRRSMVTSLFRTRLTHVGLEMELGVHTADEVGRRLEPERGPRERALLPLVHADQVDGAAIAERVAGGHAEDRRRRHREQAALLESRRHLRRPRAEQRVGIEERHLPDVVGDGVVDPAHQLPSADEELLAVLAELERVQVERRAVAAAGGVVLQAQRRTWPAAPGQEKKQRCSVQRVGRLRRRQARRDRRTAGGCGKTMYDSRTTWEASRILRAREEAVGAIEHRRVARHREAQLLQVRLRVAR